MASRKKLHNGLRCDPEAIQLRLAAEREQTIAEVLASDPLTWSVADGALMGIRAVVAESLDRCGYLFISEVVAARDSDLLGCSNFGAVGLAELRAFIADHRKRFSDLR